MLWQELHPHLGEIPGQMGSTAYGLVANIAAGGDTYFYLAGVEVSTFSDFDSNFTGITVPTQRWAVFPHEALAGQTLVYEAEILHLRPEGAAVAGRALVDGTVVAEVEIFFAHLDQNRSQQMFGEHNFVFGSEMRYLLGRLASQARSQAPNGTPG